MCRLIGVDTNFYTQIMVADIKTEYVKNIMEKADICSNISNIYLLGSVLNEKCSDDWDIDLLVDSDISRSRLSKTKSHSLFLTGLHDKDNYFQQYDVICVYGMGELKKNRYKIALFNDVLTNGSELYTIQLKWIEKQNLNVKYVF